METGTDLRKCIRATIKRKLQELGPNVDEELTDYIMVLVANKKDVHQMAEDLSLFLGRDSVKFTHWLHGVLEKLYSVAIEPGLLRPHYLQADSSFSTGNGQELGQADRRREELQAPSLSSMYFNSMDAQLRKSFTEKGLPALEPPMERLYRHFGSHIEPEADKDFAADFTGRPDLRPGVPVPCALDWRSQGSGHQGSPCQVPDCIHGYGASEVLRGVDRPRHGYRRLRDGCPTGEKVSRARKDRGAREEVMPRRRELRMLGSMEYLQSNTESEMGGPNDAHDFIPRKPPVGGSIRSKLSTRVGEEVLVSPQRIVQCRLDERDSLSLSPRFIVTLEGAPSPLRNLKDDGGGGERELYCSDEENGSVGVKRRKVLERCRFWPACESRDKCSYHHPTTQCKTFPHCSFGDKCLFIHPNCKYNGQCTRVDCPYTHNSKRSVTSSSKLDAKMPPDLCHFFPECKKMDCPFYHPKPCRFATRCKRADCYFYHPPVLPGYTSQNS
ncbi:zinc finger CCCH domain-containing protein 14-like isoform X1 [Conger conger]|uniref:zinc finger CCCH domain-containing protein 14-like isoform X1 n=1 Tax=Conger conger TaxID=82655 RepID=UPI002A59DBBC|nr:zinc finger CCCH domain-containing protein 14-like isoform X1 [Conger conger]